MTFLELCKKVRQECGIQGEGKPTSVHSQSGLLHRIIGWTRDADIFIQSLHLDWNFHWKSVEIETVINSPDVTKPNDLKTWNRESFGVNRGTADGRPLPCSGFQSWRDNFNLQINSEPSSITVTPLNHLKLSQPADAIYSIYGEYWIKPVALIENEQVPLYSEEFQRAIIEKAKMYFFEDIESEDQYRAASEGLNFWMNKLENQYLPLQQSAAQTSPGNQVVRPA